MRELFDDYIAVFVASLIGIGLVLSALIGNLILSPRQRTRPKGVAYECGMLPVGHNLMQVHVRYYLFAILFLIFDVEAAFLFPWAVTFIDVGAAAFYEMVIFIVIIGAGLAYAWKRGILNWR